MNNIYFIDTSYLIALIHKNDRWHKSALYWRDRILQNQIILLITEYILVEFANSLSVLRFRKQVGKTIYALRNNKYITVIPASTTLFDMGINLYENREDKEWSLTDCISMIVMEMQGIEEVLSTDKHFLQAGFSVLLKEM